jgi:tRNA nucleotidyltransferase (CCA-adding enzyme)
MAAMPPEGLGEALESAYPELATVRTVAEQPVYLVGGAVRDLLLGRGRTDIDLVVEGDAAALASRLGAEVVEHERFATAKVTLDGHEVDIAAARSESYPHPGALPVVEAAGGIEADLARRDFTINAIAVPLRGEADLIDPHGGREDLKLGLLRILHSRSFVDDPTRALRAARYAARFGFELEPETAELLRGADLDTVSADRRRAELLRVAAEAEAPRAFELLERWGLVELQPEGAELAARMAALLRELPWSSAVDPERAVLAAALDPPGREMELVEASPGSPSEAVELARRFGPADLAMARVRGAEWLEDYVKRWADVGLEIDGQDLIEAGVPEGPAVGRGLTAALRRKLDGEISGREEELATALAVARGGDGVA